jgi:hypothetical protein
LIGRQFFGGHLEVQILQELCLAVGGEWWWFGFWYSGEGINKIIRGNYTGWSPGEIYETKAGAPGKGEFTRGTIIYKYRHLTCRSCVY